MSFVWGLGCGIGQVIFLGLGVTGLVIEMWDWVVGFGIGCIRFGD